jgi:hypothetical protein
MYLVPADGMVGFCNEVNDGSEPASGRSGSYLLRRGDEKLKVTGMPDVPREYRPYLLKEPITAEITAVGRYRTHPGLAGTTFRETTVTVNAGKRNGLLPGMELVVTSPDMVERVKITKVSEEAAEGTVTQSGDTDRAPKVGWKLSTWAPWHTKRDNQPKK